MLRDVPPAHLHDTPHLAGITVLDQHGCDSFACGDMWQQLLLHCYVIAEASAFDFIISSTRLATFLGGGPGPITVSFVAR